MIDDRQLLRQSRNLVAAIAALLGIWFLVESLQMFGGMWQFFGTPGLGMVTVAYLFQFVLLMGSGAFLIFRRNWLARKLIRPVRADTCPGCDYPIDPAASKCPECGLTLNQSQP